MKKIDEHEYNLKLYKMALINNVASLVCFTILAIIFQKWWLVFFSILFMSFVEKKGK